MSRWILNEYIDRYDSLLGEPRSVGIYETDEAVLHAVAELKRLRSTSFPIVFREAETLEVLHVVSKNHKIDALFQSIQLAEDWLDLRRHEAYAARSDMPVSYTLHAILVEGSFKAAAPKTVWEWLRNPAL